MRAELAVRDALVRDALVRDALVRTRTRTRYIALAKALVRRDGLRVPTSASAWVPTRIAELDLSPSLTTALAPLFAVFAPLTAQIALADARIAAFASANPIATRLTTAPGVGPVTASAFVATIDDITRFRTAHELEAYLGVMPSERRSGEQRQLATAGIGARSLSARAKRARYAVVQDECLDDQRYWVDTNRKTARRVLDLMEAVLRDPMSGIGKPEPLRYFGGNVCSRRINEADRLVYEVFDDRIEFLQARYHYG